MITGSKSDIDKIIKIGLIDRNASLIFPKSRFRIIIINTIMPIKGRNFFMYLRIFSDTGDNVRYFVYLLLLNK